MNEKARQKEKKGFLYISDSETERTTKLYCKLETQVLRTKSKPVVEKRKKILFPLNNFCFAFRLHYMDLKLPSLLKCVLIHGMDGMAGYCREKRTESIWPISSSGFLKQRIFTLALLGLFFFSPQSASILYVHLGQLSPFPFLSGCPKHISLPLLQSPGPTPCFKSFCTIAYYQKTLFLYTKFHTSSDRSVCLTVKIHKQ